MARILLLGYEKTVLNNLSTALKKEGYLVATAYSVEEGLALFQSQRDFNCVICDMEMPGMTGAEVIKALKGIDPDIGIILLTQYGDTESIVSATAEGAFDCLNKPVHTQKLIISVGNAIERFKLIKENQTLNEELDRKNIYFQHINDSAQQILVNMVPKSCPVFKELDTASVYKSCECVGGDLYDIFKLGGKIFFYLLDVCGHGILPAVMTMMIKAYFQNTKLLYENTGITPDIEKVIHDLNCEMVRNTSSYLFVTLFAGMLDIHSGEISYVSAGHIDQYVQTKKGIIPLSSANTVIGIFEGLTFEAQNIRIEPGDRLFLFTDGITEIWNEEVIMTTDKMKAIISEKAGHPIKDTIDSIYKGILKLYENKKPDDDITIIGMELLPK